MSLSQCYLYFGESIVLGQGNHMLTEGNPISESFLGNIKPHFDQLRSVAQAVVCIDKTSVAMAANLGKSRSQFQELHHLMMGGIQSISAPFDPVTAYFEVARSNTGTMSCVSKGRKLEYIKLCHMTTQLVLDILASLFLRFLNVGLTAEVKADW